MGGGEDVCVYDNLKSVCCDDNEAGCARICDYDGV
jgi:hypothetical protein